MAWRHAHARVYWRWWRWSIRSPSWARIVLATAPRKADSRISNRIPLHLVDGHFGCVALDELNETTPLSRWDLDIGDLSKALEEGAELIFGYIAGKTANEDGSVVGIGELVHRLRSAVVPDWRITH